MPTKDFAGPGWRDFGAVHIAENIDDANAAADDGAVEQLQALTQEPRQALEMVVHYGSFFGAEAGVSCGGKATGANHVLPTGGITGYSGDRWVGKYPRTATDQEVTDEESVRFGELSERSARFEHFEGHAPGELSAPPSTAA